MNSCIVIGSSFAGITAALTLIQKGLKVTLIDPGVALEPGIMAKVKKLRNKAFSSWTYDDLADLKSNFKINSKGVDLKLCYGSDFPYRDVGMIQPFSCQNAKMFRSLAAGGFSHVWGCSIMPFIKKDMADWCIPYEDIVSSYRHVMDLVGAGCISDELADKIPLHANTGHRFFPLSEQSRQFLCDLLKHRHSLESQGVFFGQARLATHRDCVLNDTCCECALCLYGCCFDYLFNTKRLLKQLQTNKNFTYKTGIVVDRIKENSKGVVICCRQLQTLESIHLEADRVYLGAGVVSSTRILLDSLEAYNQTVILKHSDLFQIPFLRFKGVGDVRKQMLHTLSQLAIEIDDPSIDKNLIHLQIYGYNDFYDQLIRNKFSVAYKSLKGMIGQFLDRLFIAKGYIHSDRSSQLMVKLGPEKNSMLQITGQPNPAALIIAKKTARKLLNNMAKLKLITHPQLVHMALPGEGNHSGGSFPMKAEPKAFESDTLGRPFGFNRVYVVDSTVFPSIPSTTITLTIMANSHRIALNSLK